VSIWIKSHGTVRKEEEEEEERELARVRRLSPAVKMPLLERQITRGRARGREEGEERDTIRFALLPAAKPPSPDLATTDASRNV
jgi:hypothetical protein